jgi:mannan endo-1,4-beta-mannosidase
VSANPAFVSCAAPGFSLAGQAFRVRGANCYYLGSASDAMVEDVFHLASASGFNVLRTWAFRDLGTALNGEVCFQYQDPSTGGLRYNDGPCGLQLLDRTIALAEQHGIKLILPLVNYWDDFGGVNQYLRWFGLAERPTFFTDPQVNAAYRNYAEHLLLRTNTRTRRRYCDEPAILAWELANEPRCEIPGGVEVLCAWVNEMSAFLKSIDPNHLVGIGDEGFFRRARARKNPLYNGSYGVDCERLLNASSIDFGTCHLYPSYADLEKAESGPVQFGRRWIQEHLEAGQRAGKPIIIEEFGWPSDDQRSSRDHAFRVWLDQIDISQGAGALLWMIAARNDEGEYYPDYDRFTVYHPPNKKTLWNA